MRSRATQSLGADATRQTCKAHPLAPAQSRTDPSRSSHSLGAAVEGSVGPWPDPWSVFCSASGTRDGNLRAHQASPERRYRRSRRPRENHPHSCHHQGGHCQWSPAPKGRRRLIRGRSMCQVLSDAQGGDAVAFDQIDKAPEEKVGATHTLDHGHIPPRMSRSTSPPEVGPVSTAPHMFLRTVNSEVKGGLWGKGSR